MSIFRPGSGRLGALEAHRMLQEGTAVLLDVRETPEWRAGHAPGARHLPLSRLTAGAKVPGTNVSGTNVSGTEVPRAKVSGANVPGARAHSRLVLICRSGQRSRHAVRLLREQGWDAVDVTGGMKAWVRRGLPVQDTGGAAGTVI